MALRFDVPLYPNRSERGNGGSEVKGVTFKLFVLTIALTVLVSKSFAQWMFIGGKWREVDKSLVGESVGGHAFALAPFSRYAKAQTVETTMTPKRKLSASWAAAGICVFQDTGNFWRLALVEAPDGKTHYAELVAMSNGVWQAQSELRLKVVSDVNPNFAWQWDTPYRLRVTLNPSQITGEIFSVDGQLLWRRSFALDNVPIIRAGWMALNVQGMEAVFKSAKQTAHANGVTVMSDLYRAIVVRDPAMGNTKLASTLLSLLKGSGVKAEVASLDNLVDPGWWVRTSAGIIVLPNGKRLPATCKELLLDFLRQGGKLVVFGAPLFDEPMFKVERGGKSKNQKWMSRQEIENKRKGTKPQNLLFKRFDEEELRRWRHHSSHPEVSDRLTVEPALGIQVVHQALRLDFDLKGWAIFSREFAETPFPPEHSLTCFWAKGTTETKTMMVEWRERDGSRWFAHVPLTTTWRLVVLTPADFTFRLDSPTRGKRGFSGDRFNPQEARALVLGMEAPMPAGKHTIWVAGIGTAQDPFGDVATDFEPPVLEALSPAYKLFPLRKATGFRDFGLGIRDLTVKEMPSDAVAPVPRWRGIGFTNGERFVRWQPLLMACEGDDERGALVWLVRYANLPYPHASWLLFGSANETFWLRQVELVRSALKRALTLWHQSVWLLEGGSDRFTAYPNEPTTLGAVVVNSSSQPQTVSVHFRVTGENSILYDRQESATVEALASQIVRVTLPPLPTGDYWVTVQLVREGQGVDEIAHGLSVIPHPQVTEADKIKVKDGHFVVSVPKEKRWFAFGVNFWPRYVAGKEQADYWRHWLDPTNYDPELVESDLRILKQIGMNCVSVQYLHPRQALPLRDFLYRCHKHGIKVNLFIAGAHPLDFQPELVRQLIEVADLANQPSLFAYDIAWEPRWGNYNERRKHDGEWVMWLEEQYGSVENAERDWGFKLPRDEQGKPTVPKDEHLLNDGGWRVMAAAYRRFLDDFISRKYREVVRFIRRLDPNHLIGARTGFGGGPFGAEAAFPFDHTAGAKHLDFISPEGWNLGWLGHADETQFARAVFITAYARWAGKGKPVFWAEFGLTLRHGPFSLDWYEDEKRMEAQAKLYDAIYRLMQISDADGAMAWWFPGGYRVDEKSDFGIINPDGTLRPAAEVARRWSNVLTNLPLEPSPKPTVTITIDRDENARGPMALWLKHGDETAKLTAEGKRVVLVTEGMRTSDDVPELAIGNTPWSPGKPPKFLNGEINAVWVSTDGEKWREVKKGESISTSADYLWLRVEIGNTGEATWLPPDECREKRKGITLRVSVEGGETVEAPVPKRVKPLEDVVLNGISVPLPKSNRPLRVTVRLYWNNSPFGERVEFTIQP